MKRMPPIDMHAHIEPDIAAGDLLELGALVFAPTRSLDQAEQVLKRTDSWTVWGVGCHPGLVGAQKTFDIVRFNELIGSASYVSEVGLDGKSRVSMDLQRRTFDAILSTLQNTPRLTSIHSFAATDQVLQRLADKPIHGAVLHWWLGSEEQTQQAVELGCYFSVNASMLRNIDAVARLPIDRVLAETDHPFGDRANGQDCRPGNVADVERALARIHALRPDEARTVTWRNLSQLVSNTKIGLLLPRQARTTLVAVA